MAPFSDPNMNQLMERYFDRNLHPQYLYQGSQENIIKELKAWILHRKKVYKEQQEVRDQAQKSSKEIMRGQIQISDFPAMLKTSVDANNRATALDNEAGEGTKQAVYLLHTLRSRGFTWPVLWWRPEDDGGVCSFLGTVDETFDAHATLRILEDKEEEERLLATRADIGGKFDATVKGWAGEKAKKDKDAGGSTGQGQSSQGSASKSRQEKRAEAREEAKAKEKEKEKG